MATNEWNAAMAILDGPLARKVPAGAIDPARERIDWPLIEANCYSSTEQLLYDVALDLWNGHGAASIGDLVRCLDDRQWAAVIAAITAFRRPSHPTQGV